MSTQDELPTEYQAVVLEAAQRAAARRQALYEHLMQIHDAHLGQSDDEEEE